MKTLAQFCFFLAMALALSAFAQGGPNAEMFSENKKFSAEISATQFDKPLLTVFRHDGENVKVQVWSRALAPKDDAEDDHFRPGTPIDSNMLRAVVTDDGKAVILRPRYAHLDLPALRVLTQAGGDKAYQKDELRDLLTGGWEDWAAPQVLEILLMDAKPPVFALWYPPASEWLVLDLEKLTVKKADAAAVAKLDAAALVQAREIAQQSRPTGLKKLLQPVMQRAAEFAPNLIGPAQAPAGFSDRAEAAYRFLAEKKNPGDKKLIEELLKADLQKAVSMGPGFQGEPEAMIGLASRERAVADELLAKWEGRDAPEEEEFDFTFGAAGTGKKLSGVSGYVNLPFGAPKNAGAIWIYLIPASVSKGKWAGEDSVLKVWHNPSEQIFRGFPGQGEAPPLEQLRFYFHTVEPGEYRLKAVWDRRPPNAPTDDKAICVPEAGDYESAESETLKLAAGQKAAEVILNCTNRVGEAKEYFAADDLWQKQHPVIAQKRRARSSTRKVLTQAPLREWVVATNENNASVQLRGIQLVEMRSSDDENVNRHLEVTFRMSAVKRDEHPSIRGVLVDEHGCSFETSGHSSRGSAYQMTFTVVPYGAKQFELTFSRQDFQDKNGRPYQNGPRETKLGSFTLTNLCRIKPADWKPDAESLKKDLDIVTVELASFDPRIPEFGRPPGYMGPGGRPGQPAQNKFNFSANGKTAPGWRKVKGEFRDRWGNVSASIGNFCEQEEMAQYVVTLMRDPVKGVFAADEKFEIPVKEIPGAGASVPLGIRKEVQGLEFEVLSVGGTGEFTYVNGQFVSAKEEVDEDEVVPQAGPQFGPQFAPNFQGRPVQPKLYLKGFDPRQVGMDWNRRDPARGEVTLASKIPHVVCRVPEPESDTKFALVEQDTSVPDPLNPPSRHMYGGPRSLHNVVQFLPLEHRAGDTDRKLTFVVQKTRTASFIVRVPKGTAGRNARR
jgi:hypothetical protein